MGIRSLKTASISTGVKRSKVWDQSAAIIPPLTPDYESIATSTGGSSTITFSSIPSTYKHLQLRVSGTLTSGDAVIRLNNDTTNGNYGFGHFLYGTGTDPVLADGLSPSSYPPFLDAGAGSCTVTQIIDILDYTASADKYKTIRTLWGWDLNGSGRVGMNSVLWKDSSVVNRIDLTGRNYSGTGTVIGLYGIKG
jgi:hypothetical protein